MDLVFEASDSNNELINMTPICLYRGETANIFFNTKMQFNNAVVKLNGMFVAKVKTPVVGINASRLINGANSLQITLYDVNDAVLGELSGVIVKRDSIRGMNNIEQEFTELVTELAKLKTRVEELELWRKQIDDERSGYDA